MNKITYLLLALLLILSACNQPKTNIKKFYLAYSWNYTENQYRWMAKTFDLIIFHDNHAPNIHILRESNPDIILLVYKFSGLDSDWEGHSAGGFENIWTNHQDYFLKDTKGNYVKDKGSFNPDVMYMMDPGNTGWQRYAADKYVQAAKDHGWDGIFLDVVHTGRPIWDTPLAGYKTQNKYDSAVFSFLEYVNNKLKEDDLIFVFNGITLVEHPGLYSKALDTNSGVLDEHFTTNLWAEMSETQIIEQISYMSQISRSNYYLAMPHIRPGTVDEDYMFGLAAYLLGAEEYAYFYAYYPEGPSMAETKHKKAEITSKYYSIKLGEAIGPYYFKNSLIARDFKKGIVLLNPKEQPISISFNEPYKEFDTNKQLKSFTLQPRSAKILYSGQ